MGLAILGEGEYFMSGHDAATGITSRVPSIPETLQIVTDGDFELIRECFSRIGFSTSQLRQKFGLRNAKDLYRFAVQDELSQDLLGLISRLFVSEESVRRDSLMKAGLPAAVWSALERANLVGTFPHAPEYCTALARLQPVGSLILASDRHIRIDASPVVERIDSVYDPLEESTSEYLRFMPRKACERFLELCSGTGVAALRAAASFARRSWASDVTERCVHFAKFNAKLNGIINVSVLLSDLFGSLKDTQFDYIVAHPPYMPSLADQTIYRAGGPIGDELLIKIIQALPAHLAVGGSFYARATVTDRQGMSFEAQVRTHLGEHSNAFDLLVMTLRESSPVQFCLDMRKNRKYSPVQTAKQLSLYRANGIFRLVSCAFVLHRYTDDRQPFTARYPAMDPARLVHLFRSESAAALVKRGKKDSCGSPSVSLVPSEQT
jgi:hypothetical protein